MTGTLRWLARRLALSVLVLLGAATVSFGALQLAPGDPVQIVLGGTAATPAAVAQVRADLGLDDPLAVRYGDFLGHLVRGDLGHSFQLNADVSDVILDQLWPTVQLALAGFAIALGLALALALSTAGRRPRLRFLSSTLELVLSSSPGFWIGVLLLTVFSFQWQLFPATGGDGPDGLVLPAVTLAVGMVGPFAQVLREGMESVLREPFALSALARGTDRSAVLTRHALRHALIPLVTLSGWAVGTLLSGAVVIETVFTRQGLGRVMASAISGRDLPVVTGVVVVSAVAFVLINLVVDWLYQVVDPRLKEAHL
ncbi:ABC transporter permease [Kitasatospora sp. NPDC057692]|uniref:ABC transporter permease n=1 Tax=Kitasatospora sp. NPDC057692 TaxID=3346215 RepID=UPI003674CFB1